MGRARRRRATIATRGTRELSDFLTEWVSPHLRAAGYRKSHHTYRRVTSRGDQAVFQFRGYALGFLGSFLLDIWVAHEPIWDSRHHREGTATPTLPERLDSFHAGVRWQQGAYVGAAASRYGGTWAYADASERAVVGTELARLLVDDWVPEVDALLERDSVLENARRGRPFHRGSRPSDVIDALTVSDGPAHEFEDLLTRRSGDAQFVSWAHDRREGGPTWRRGDSVEAPLAPP